MLEIDRCSSCAFWWTERLVPDVSHGQCRRFPPELFARQRLGRVKTPGRAAWPDTARDHWCGEWKDKNGRRP